MVSRLKTWAEIVKMPIGQLPRVPIEPIIGTTAAVTTPFVQLYGSYAVDLLISNLDLANVLTYRLNSLTRGANKTLGIGGEIAFNNVLLESVVITPDAVTGSFELLPFLLPRELLG
ncbi:hypothetical protein ES703_43470 [subsurface metagenome]